MLEIRLWASRDKIIYSLKSYLIIAILRSLCYNTDRQTLTIQGKGWDHLNCSATLLPIHTKVFICHTLSNSSTYFYQTGTRWELSNKISIWLNVNCKWWIWSHIKYHSIIITNATNQVSLLHQRNRKNWRKMHWEDNLLNQFRYWKLLYVWQWWLW